MHRQHQAGIEVVGAVMTVLLHRYARPLAQAMPAHAAFRGAAKLRKCLENVLMRPFLAEDPGEQVVGTAYTVGRVFRILHCQDDGCCQQSPRRNRVGKRAFQPQILVFRLPPNAEGAKP